MFVDIEMLFIVKIVKMPKQNHSLLINSLGFIDSGIPPTL